jgi:hypothetical protein
MVAKIKRGWLRGLDLSHRPLGYEPSRAMLTHCDSIGPSTSPFQKVPTPTPGFGAKLVPSYRWLAGSLPQHSLRKIAKTSENSPEFLTSRQASSATETSKGVTLIVFLRGFG